MAYNKGKAFEDKFKGDFQKVPNATIDRLYDVTNGYKNIKQCSDFIGFIATKQVDEVVYGNIYYLECKSCKGASIPFSAILRRPILPQRAGRDAVTRPGRHGAHCTRAALPSSGSRRPDRPCGP